MKIAATQEAGVGDAAASPAVIWLLRLIYLSYSMAIGTIHPFLSVYYHSLGYDGSIIGILGSIAPFTKFLAGPIWGVISDKAQRPLTVLSVTMLLSLIGQLLVHFCASRGKKNDGEENDDDDYRIVMILLCVTAICSAPIKPLIDSVAIGQLHERDRSQLFGTLKVWSLIGSGISTSIAGRFLTYDKGPELSTSSNLLSKNSFLYTLWINLSGYNLIFFLHAVLHIPTFIAIILLAQRQSSNNNLSNEESIKNTSGSGNKQQPMGSSLKEDKKEILIRSKQSKDDRSIWSKTFLRFDTIVFFLLVFFLGVNAGIGDNFVYIRFQEVGISKTDMGMSRLLSASGGAVMSWYSGTIRTWLGGIEQVLVFSLVAVGTRFWLFSEMKDTISWSWLYGYIGELIRGMTFGCFWSSSSVYASQISPSEFRSTMVCHPVL